MIRSAKRFAAIIVTMIILSNTVNGQATMPDILLKGSVREQLNYLNEKTLIYEGYRAIREDMFQIIKNNALDSLQKARNTISLSAGKIGLLNNRIDSLGKSLNSTKQELLEMTRTKNAITILGITLNKNLYNSITWIIIAGLAFMLVVGYLAFRRSHTITRNTKMEYTALKEEFEQHRQKSRLEREKMSMDHFKEIQKMRKI